MELTIKNLTKSFKDKTAVDDVSLTITPGVWGLLGANGAGKTTLMRMIAGILTPSRGNIYYDGVKIGDLGEAYRDVFGYLPQTFGFYPEFKVIDYLRYMAGLKGLSRKTAERKIDELLGQLSLEEVRGKQVRKLSGGMQRRVGIAQALLNDPEILILDEPTSGLDPGERIRFRRLIAEFSRERIVVISTHIVPDVEYIAACNAVMKDGKIIDVGTTEELVKTVKGKVWEAELTTRELAEYEGRVPIVNVRSEKGEKVLLRYLSETGQVPGSRPAAPHLEDLYLWLFSERSGEK